MVLAFHLSGDQNKHFIHSFPALSDQLHQKCESDSLHHKCLSYPPSNPSPQALCHLFPSLLVLTISFPTSSFIAVGGQGLVLWLRHHSASSAPCFLPTCAFLFLWVPSLPVPLGQSCLTTLPSCPTEICLPHITSLTFAAPKPPPLMLVPQAPFHLSFFSGEGFFTPQGRTAPQSACWCCAHDRSSGVR